jgi:hypothetical protein
VIGVSRFVFFLRDRPASRLVGRVPIAQVGERLLADSSGRIFGRRRAGVDGRMLAPFARFLVG